MWKAPKKKNNSFTESFLRPETKPEGEHLKAQETVPTRWESQHEEHSPFVQEFFNFFHRSPNEDEKISLRVLGI